MPHYVYILQCNDDTLYTGCTNDIERRLHQHNNLKNGAQYTKIRRPVELKYFEKFKTLKEARTREAAIKRLKREEKLSLFSPQQRLSKIKSNIKVKKTSR